MKRTVTAFAPATVANVACGFDVLGFAVSEPGDTVVATVESEAKSPGDAQVLLTGITGDEGRLPLSIEKNTACVAVTALLAHLQSKAKVSLELQKGMPLGSGMGSSAASAAAALVAVNEALGSPLARSELVPFGIAAEFQACGSAHADNVAPAILGNFVLVRSYRPLDLIPIPSPPALHCTLVHPHIEIKTSDARRILRSQVPLRDAITQWGNIAGLVAGLLTSDLNLVGRSLEDVIIEPMRSLLIPGFQAAKTAALAEGALGCSISGSGPSMFALSSSKEIAERAGAAMVQAFLGLEIAAERYVSRVNPDGAVVTSGR